MKSYGYLSNPYVTIQGIDEVEEYNNTIKAMHIMGMSNEDIICNIFDLLFKTLTLPSKCFFPI